MAVTDTRFRAMASGVRLLIVGGEPTLSHWAEQRVHDLESRWSRFLPGSDISRLNRSQGRTVSVSPDTIMLIETMQLAAAATGGAYDPTMLFEILEAGYVNSIDVPGRVSVMVDLPSLGASVHQVIVDRETCSTAMPAGLGLDPGGIGKGLAGDLVVAELLERGATGALVSIGGDIACAGTPSRGDGWEIAIGDPFDRAGEMQRIEVDAGGIATSSTLSRRWNKGGRNRHHILDPRRKRSSDTDLAAATVIGRAGWQAEAFATAAILQGFDRGPGYLAGHDLHGVFVALDGRVAPAGRCVGLRGCSA